MRSDVVDRILKVEDTADQIIENAESEAKKIVQQAQADAARMVREASDKAAKEGAALTSEAEALCKAHIESYQQEKRGNATWNADSALLDRAAGRIIDIVTQTEVFD